MRKSMMMEFPLEEYQARLDKLMVDLCMGCGCCTFVCPAKRPVAQTMSLAKAMQRKAGK